MTPRPRTRPLRRSFVLVTASVVVASLGCGGSVDGASADGGPLPTRCPSDKPTQGTACAVDPSTECMSPCSSSGAQWSSQCVDGQWNEKDGFHSCNPPGSPRDAGVPDATPDVATTCPDAKPIDGTACAVDPAAYCSPPCDVAHAGPSFWGAQCIDHRWKAAVGSCNPPPASYDAGPDVADADAAYRGRMAAGEKEPEGPLAVPRRGCADQAPPATPLASVDSR